MKAIGRRMFFYHTVCEIILYDFSGDAKEILDECESSAKAVQSMLNVYDEQSELSLLNRNYLPGVPYPLSEELFNLLRTVWHFSRLCSGAFDMTVGSLMRLWDFTAYKPIVPEPFQIEEARKKAGFCHLSFGEEDCTITIHLPGISIDGGGFGKGYAVEKAVEILRRHKVTSAVINYGGNLFLLGCRTAEEEEGRWKVGIQKPWAKRGECMGILSLENLGAATSAGYERYFEAEGKRYSHILNPMDGKPVETKLQSVTVISDSLLVTDLMSTTFFVLGLEKGEEIAERIRKYAVLEYVARERDEICLSKGASYLFQKV